MRNIKTAGAVPITSSKDQEFEAKKTKKSSLKGKSLEQAANSKQKRVKLHGKEKLDEQTRSKLVDRNLNSVVKKVDSKELKNLEADLRKKEAAYDKARGDFEQQKESSYKFLSEMMTMSIPTNVGIFETGESAESEEFIESGVMPEGAKRDLGETMAANRLQKLSILITAAQHEITEAWNETEKAKASLSQAWNNLEQFNNAKK